MGEKLLHFEVTTKDLFPDIFGRYSVNGRPALNKTSWRGHEPQTCCVIGAKGTAFASQTPQPVVFKVTVKYRPRDFVSFVGHTKYVGWRASVLDTRMDGTLLDGQGQILKDGNPPVFREIDVHPEIDFNEIDFGEFIREEEVPPVKEWDYKEFMDFCQTESDKAGFFYSSTEAVLVAPRRSRPNAKLVITEGGIVQAGTDGFGTRLTLVGKETPHLSHVVYVKLTEMMTEFLEGRISLKNTSAGEDAIFVAVSSALVDASGVESKFNIMDGMLPETFLRDLAMQMSTMFAISAEVVKGTESGLYIRLDKRK